MSNGNDIRDFITAYLSTHPITDATDQEFHEQFYQRYGGKRQETFYGAQMVYKAQLWLKRMYDEKTLRRKRFSLGEVGADGFPKWVYTYSLRR